MLIQQGDVLIKTIDRIPAGANPVKRKNGRFVLAEGEVTGHAHTVEEKDTDLGVQLVELNGTLYLKTFSDTIIKHEEHKPVTVPAGEYEIGIVQEYDHFKEEAKRVQD